MATTRIMPLHVGKGRTESRAISDIIDYVANPKKTDNGRLITGYACDSRTADAEFLLAKRQYIAATGRVRGADDVIAYHVRQSFCPGEITPEEANRLGVEFAKRFTKGNHAFVVCTHIDMENYLMRDTDVSYNSITTLKANVLGIKNVVLLVGGMIGSVFALVGLINFINLVMTNIVTRRHEFATMQSIGMTNRQLRKMMISESFSYVLLAGIVGTLVAATLGMTLLRAMV